MSPPRFGIFLVATMVLLTPIGAVAQDVDTGAADFTRYVSLGDSLTAGFWSLGLAERQQKNSYPALIYRQVHGTTEGFRAPLMTEPGFPNQLELVSLDPVTIQPKEGREGVLLPGLAPPFDNLGVVGADVNDVLNTLCGDYFEQALGSDCTDEDNPVGQTMLQQALALDPTLVTLWIGSNDALGVAISGRIITGLTLTELDEFTTKFHTIVDALAASGADLVIATVPQVRDIPFVNTVPWYRHDTDTGDAILDDQGQMIPLQGIACVDLPCEFPSDPVEERALTEDDFVLLSGEDAIKSAGWGIPGLPLTNDMVLDVHEAAVVSERIDDFNDVIHDKAAEVGAVVWDAAEYFADLVENGLPVGGIEYGPDFLTGGLFSYDAIHPTSMGYAVIANQFITTINAHFNAQIPPVDLTPFVFGEESDGSVGVTAQQAPSFVFSPGTLATVPIVLGLDFSELPGIKRLNSSTRSAPRKRTRPTRRL